MSDARIRVHLVPRAAKDELAEVRDGVLIARVSAPPVDGRANRALCRLIAARLGLAPSRVEVVKGTRSREKVIRVEAVEPEVVGERLGMR